MILQQGSRVGQYEVTRRIGVGGAGTVYEVRHVVLGVDRALKLLHTTFPMAVERLLEEGRIQAQIRHPNVVRVLDTLAVGNQAGLVMELVEGPSLGALMRRATLPVPEALRLFREISEGVAAAHALGVVHRDLKPGNVLLDTTAQPPRARVVDFGVAHVLDADSSRTETGARIGTAAYMAPEQLRGGRGADPRVDVFSLGMLFHELLLHRPAFVAEDLVDRIAEIERGLPARVPERVDAATWDLLRRCLSNDPADRPADGRAVLDALDRATSEAVEPSPLPSKAPATWLAGGVALGVLAGFGVGVVVLAAQPSPTEAVGSSVEEALRYRVAAEQRPPAEALAYLRASAALGEPLDVPMALDLLGRGGAAMRFQLDQPANAVAVDDEYIAAADRSGLTRIWRRDGTPVATVRTGVEQPRDMALIAGGFTLVPDALLGRGTRSLAWSFEGKPLLQAAGTVVGGQTSANGRWLAAVADIAGGRELSLWDLQTRTRKFRTPTERPVHRLGESGFVMGPRLDAWTVLDSTGATVATGTARARNAALSGSGEVLWTIDPDHRLSVHDLLDGTTRALGKTPRGWAWLAATEHCALVAPPRAGVVHRYADDGQVALAAPGPVALVSSTSDGLAVATTDGQLQLYSSECEPRPETLRGTTAAVGAVARGPVPAVAQLDGTVAVFLDPVPDLGGQVVRDAVLSDAGLGTRRGDALVVDGREVGRLEASERALSWSSETPGRVVAVRARGARVGDVETVASNGGRVLDAIAVDRVPVVLTSRSVRSISEVIPLPQPWALAPRDDRSVWVVHGTPAQLSVVQVEPLEVLRTLPLGDGTHRGVSTLRRHGGRLLAGTWDGALIVVGPDGEASTVQRHAGAIHAIEVDGDAIITASSDGMVRGDGWSVDAGAPVSALTQTPSGRWFAAGRGRVVELSTEAVLRERRVAGTPRRLAWIEGALYASDGGTAWRWTEQQLDRRIDGAWLGRWTNLRVCRETGDVIPVFPATSGAFAPEGCARGGSAGDAHEGSPE